MSLSITYGTLTALTGWSTALASVGASGTSTSGAVTTTVNHVKLECEFSCDAASTETVDLFLVESLDGGTDYSTTATADMRYLGTVTLNGTTTVRKVLDIFTPANNWKVHVINNDATNGLGTSTVSYQTITYSDA